MTHVLRIGGLALLATGIVALVHYSLRIRGRLPESLRNDTLSPRVELIVATLLIVVGLPVLVFA